MFIHNLQKISYVIKKFSFKEKKQISFNEAEIIGSEIIELFKKNEFDKCILFFKDLWVPQPISFMAFPAQKYGAENFFLCSILCTSGRDELLAHNSYM